ncbi:MAG TPA: hypothetical protein VF940_13910, partial [Streptosporangiaceae bacterium]
MTVISSGEGTYLVARIRGGSGKRLQPRVGAPDRALTPNAGLAAVSGLCGRLGVVGAIDAAAGPVRQRGRGFGAGELLTGIAAGATRRQRPTSQGSSAGPPKRRQATVRPPRPPSTIAP